MPEVYSKIEPPAFAKGYGAAGLARKVLRRLVLIALAVERLEERDERVDIGLAQPLGPDQSDGSTVRSIQVRHGRVAVELDHVAKCGKRSVVHVGRMFGDFPQSRSLEGAEITLNVADGEAAFIPEFPRRGIPPDAEIVKAAVGEIEAGVTGRAASGEEKQLTATLGLLRDRVRLTGVTPSIVRRVAAHARAHVIRQGDRDVLLRDDIRAEGFTEVRTIAFHRRQPIDHRLVIETHLVAIGDRHEHLVFEA